MEGSENSLNGQRISLWRNLFFTLITLCLFFVVLEGLFSTVHVVHTWYSKARFSIKPPFPSEQYDQDLGWVPIPNLNRVDGFGPGKSVRTNSQGFRADVDYGLEVPPGRIRIVASGDSMTFGFAVADDHAWPKLLESLDDRLQVINLAVSGYGVDQAYLRSQRDARPFERQIHIFALILNDIDRMRSSMLRGYGKPLLAIEDGELTATNIPVPEYGFLRTWLEVNKNLFQESRTIQVVSQVYQKIGNPLRPSDYLTTPELQQILIKLLQTLDRSEKDRGSTLVVVLLPMERDYLDQGDWHKWRWFLQDETAALGIHYISLIEDFQRLSVSEMEALFRDADDFHYGKDGNAWAAKRIYERLLEYELLSPPSDELKEMTLE